MKVRNTFIIFIVSGFWHGANWTFVIWGALNAIYFLPLLLTNKNRQNLETVAEGSYLPSIKEFFKMAITFGLSVFAWIFFRADYIGHAFNYLSEIFSSSLFSVPFFRGLTGALTTIILTLVFVFIEWIGRERQYAIAGLDRWRNPIRWAFIYTIILAIFWFGGKEQPFIYFQF